MDKKQMIKDLKLLKEKLENNYYSNSTTTNVTNLIFKLRNAIRISKQMQNNYIYLMQTYSYLLKK